MSYINLTGTSKLAAEAAAKDYLKNKQRDGYWHTPAYQGPARYSVRVELYPISKGK